jgi:tetratricopeptide (TPR) repeat protein
MDGNLQQQIFRPTACISHEELRQYLSGRMAREGQRRVENHLLDCPLCSDAVEGVEEAGSHLTDDLEDFEAFSQKLPGQFTTAKVRQLQPGGYLRQALAVAAMLVVGAVAYFSFFNKTLDGPALYAKYYTAYGNDVPVSMRHANAPDVNPNFAQALTAYSDGNFTQAVMLFERALQQQPNHEATLFYAGLSNLEASNVDKAESYLGAVADGKGIYAKKAGWYLVMCDLKAGKKEAAAAKLDKIISASEIMVNEAKSLREEL